MNKDNRNLTGVFLFFLLLYLIILAYVYHITITQHIFYQEKALHQHTMTLTLMPPRGTICDRNGKNLTINRQAYAAYITPIHLKNPLPLKNFLATHFPIALKRWHQNPKSYFMYIERRLSPAQIDLINKANLTDIYMVEEPQRFYPSRACSSVVGLTDIDNQGTVGIELLYNTALQGKNENIIVEKEARTSNFYFNKNVSQHGIQGQTIQLTLDSTLQFLLYNQLEQYVKKVNAQEGAVLVVDPSTGDILSMVSYPTFDPNNCKVLDLNTTKNSSITNAYELGSVMKAFTALALLEEKLVNDEECIDCKNSTVAWIKGRKISTVKPGGLLTFSEILASSNNIGIATLAQRLGVRLYDHLKRLGFGELSSVTWPGQQKGFVNPPSNWSLSSLISLSFGYEIRATLLQLAQAFCIIACEGNYIPLRLLLKDETSSRRIYSKEATQHLKLILEKTVTQGTARKAALPNCRVWGKTGTANLALNGHYSLQHNLYTFVGVIEKESYQRLIITFIKDVGRGDVYASTIAVSLFTQLAPLILVHDHSVSTS